MPLSIRIRSGLAVVAVFVSRASFAQEDHPNVAAGTRSETLYSLGAGDQVSVFSGGLTYRLPIGEPVAVGPQLVLAPFLAYNSGQSEASWENLGCGTPESPVFSVQAAGDRWVGLGWRLHFGRLRPIHDFPRAAQVCSPFPPKPPRIAEGSVAAGMLATAWAYEEPDGTLHTLYDRRVEATCDILQPACGAANPGSGDCWAPRAPGQHCFNYTHDGSQIRADFQDPDYGGAPAIYFPDGTVRVLGFNGGRRPNPTGLSTVTDLEFADITTNSYAPAGTPPHYYTTRMLDRHGNEITVQYYGQAGAPPHPLAALGVPAHNWDVIPYKAFPTALPSVAFDFLVETRSYQPFGSTSDWMPRVTAILAPHPGDAALTASFELEETDLVSSGPRRFPTLTRRTVGGLLPHAFAYSAADRVLTSVTLPPGGVTEYQWGIVTFLTRSVNPTCYPSQSCYGYVPSYGLGVVGKTEKRKVKTSIAGAETVETSPTTYSRFYDNSALCDDDHRSNCQMIVDVVGPDGRTTRTRFAETDQYTNAALYGRPLYTQYLPPAGAGSAYRTTTYYYDFDGGFTLFDGRKRSTFKGFEHNTRETYRVTTWGSDPLRGSRVERLGWDGYGHFQTTIAYETTGGVEREIRRVVENHLNHETVGAGATWILEPLMSRTVSRPATAEDPAGANLSTAETFNVNLSTGFVDSRSVASDDPGDSRVLTTSWVAGTSASAACLQVGASSAICANRGLPVMETTTLSGAAPGEASGTTSHRRRVFYQYGAPSAAFDEDPTTAATASFYTLDLDLGPTGKPIKTRSSESRTSLTGAPNSVEVKTDLDAAGRPARRYLATGAFEEYLYAAQSVTRFLCDGAFKKCVGLLGVERTFFDERARPTVQLRRLPGASSYAYRVTTLDAANRRAALSEWRAISCADPYDPCPELKNLQDARMPDGSPTAGYDGTSWWLFDLENRPTKTRVADGSEVDDVYGLWGERTSTRRYNSPMALSVTTVNRDSLGRVTSVVEPAASKYVGTGETFAAMNPSETTLYRYDHADRLIRASKLGLGGLSSGQPPNVTQERTRKYDDFGGLLEERTPESSMAVRVRDARGNPLVTTDNLAFPYDPTFRTLRTYDLSGRLLTVKTESDSQNLESYAYDFTNIPAFGASNGRLVRAIRTNHAKTTSKGSAADPPVDFGYFDAIDYYYYGGPGGLQSQRQSSTVLLRNRAAVPIADPMAESVKSHFESAGWAIDSLDDTLGIATGGKGGKGSEREGLQSAADPAGWFVLQYQYDGLGRLTGVTYPRRDEGFATQVTYGYDNNWQTATTVELKDPFWGVQPTLTATRTFGTSGMVTQTVIKNGGVNVLRLDTPQDATGMGRPATWAAYRGAADTLLESRGFTYDGSGNILSLGTEWYRYDARGRLTRDWIAGRTGNPENREYDGFGNFVTSYRSGLPWNSLNVDASTNRIGGTFGYDTSRGTMTWDPLRQLGRDYYADSRLMTEYPHAGDNVQTSAGLSLYFSDAGGERPLTFWGQNGCFRNQLYRHAVRDEGGKVLTDYRGRPDDACQASCSILCTWKDIYSKDYVWIGNQALITLSQAPAPVGGTPPLPTIRVSALDHLGTPRQTVDQNGTFMGTTILDTWGEEIVTTGIGLERHRFTNHERDHVSGDDGPGISLSDNMHARTYVPMLYRFVSPDPKPGFRLFDPQSMNRYAYVLGNPVNLFDPHGFAEGGFKASVEVVAEDPYLESFRQHGLWVALREAESRKRLVGIVLDKAAYSTVEPMGRFMVGAVNDNPEEMAIGLSQHLSMAAFEGGGLIYRGAVPARLFHYTDEAGAAAIAETGFLLPGGSSLNRVWATGIPPAKMFGRYSGFYQLMIGGGVNIRFGGRFGLTVSRTAFSQSVEMASEEGFKRAWVKGMLGQYYREGGALVK